MYVFVIAVSIKNSESINLHRIELPCVAHQRVTTNMMRWRMGSWWWWPCSWQHWWCCWPLQHTYKPSRHVAMYKDGKIKGWVQTCALRAVDACIHSGNDALSVTSLLDMSKPTTNRVPAMLIVHDSGGSRSQSTLPCIVSTRMSSITHPAPPLPSSSTMVSELTDTGIRNASLHTTSRHLAITILWRPWWPWGARPYAWRMTETTWCHPHRSEVYHRQRSINDIDNVSIVILQHQLTVAALRCHQRR